VLLHMASQHPQSLSVQIESIQKRAIIIVLNCGRHISHTKMLADTDICSLQQRRNIKAKTFFSVNPSARLVSFFRLLPSPRDNEILSRLRDARRT